MLSVHFILIALAIICFGLAGCKVVSNRFDFFALAFFFLSLTLVL